MLKFISSGLDFLLKYVLTKNKKPYKSIIRLFCQKYVSIIVQFYLIFKNQRIPAII